MRCGRCHASNLVPRKNLVKLKVEPHRLLFLLPRLRSIAEIASGRSTLASAHKCTTCVTCRRLNEPKDDVDIVRMLACAGARIMPPWDPSCADTDDEKDRGLCWVVVEVPATNA